MGFDNECILNIQSLPGEYFCPVCRTLIYPHEALQTQCTHLFCKPCLAYVVATTKACPYDGYLVTETDSKPLVESNKPLAETIGKVAVHCLYNKSGCQWQGMLSACITHGSTCAYGNSPVICNRCGTQIVHRQVQEHVQLCPGTHQADGSQVQPLTATAQAVTKDPALVSSVGSAVATATTVPSATTATAVTASSVATGGSASATTAMNVAAPPPFPGASAPQASATEHWYPQQYSQYYQQQYPGYNPYAQQHQQYGQYQQDYQQYTQPQMQVASHNINQASTQSAQVMQPSQPQQWTLSQPQHQAQLQTSSGYPQTQLHQVQSQPQIQPSLPHLQAPAGQMQPQQPVQSAYQVPPMLQHSQVPFQLTAPQTQPTVHQPASTQVSNQQFAVPSTLATSHQIQPIVQAQPPQQQHTQLQTLPQQQNLQPQMQLNQQIQHQPPQVQPQSYQLSQAYPQPVPYMQPQNTSYPQQQMTPGAPLQQPPHASYQQGLVSQHPVAMRPPLPGSQLAVLPQGIQHIPQHQQNAGYHAQRPPMHPIIPSQAPQQGFPPRPSAPSQAGQSYQQGIPSTQQQVHSHPLQAYGPPYGHHHVTGYGCAGQQVQTSAVRPMNYAAPQQQFQPQSSCTVNNLQTSVISQQPSMLGATDTGGKPTGHGSLASETQAPKSEKGKSENTSGVAHNSAIGKNRTDYAESSVMKPTMSQPLDDERINGENNDFGSGTKDVRTGVALDSADVSTGKDGRVGNSHAPGLQGGKHHKASDSYNNLEKGRSVQKASQKNAGPPSANPFSDMGPQHPFGSDKMFHQHMMNSGPMPYDMQGQPNQVRPSKHSFAENTWPLMQQPHGSSHPGMAQRTFGENQIQSPMPHPTGIRPGGGMVRPPVVSHDTMPSFVPDPLGRPHPPGTLKSNASGERLRSFAAHTGRHSVDHNDIEDHKQLPVPGHLEMGPNSFKRTLEFDHHGTDGMPDLRNPGPFFQGMSSCPGGVLRDFPGSVNLPGNAQHAFDGPVFPHFHPGHMHPDDHNVFADYSLHGFSKEPDHFDLGGLMRNTGAGWCRICMFNCGSVENLDFHVQTKEHQLCAMDLVLKMKHDVANRQKPNHGRPKPFHNNKVVEKGHFRGDKR